MKRILVSGFAVLVTMMLSTTVTAQTATQIVAQANEVRVATGQGNGYRYEIWTDSRNTYYRLKVWQVSDYPNGPQITPSRFTFPSMGEAHDHFGCQFEGKILRTCIGSY